MYECHVQVFVRVLAVGVLQSLGSVLEPGNLVWLDPVVASIMGFIRRVGVGIEHVECQGGMLAVMCLHLDEVVANSFNSVWASF